MEQSFWESKWGAGQIGFHLDRPNPALVAHWPEHVEAAGSVLVPLCGKSNDLHWLRERGHGVHGVEFVRTAAEAFFSERGLVPDVVQEGRVAHFERSGLHIHVADFFALSPKQLEPCDWVYDRAAMVAIEPGRRRPYVEQLHALSKPGAGLLLINFVHDIGSGPPHSIEPAELEQHVRGLFDIELRHERDILAHEPRFAERGATFMREQVWWGRRLGD